MRRVVREDFQEHGGRRPLAPLVAMIAASGLSLAIVYNSLLAQNAGPGLAGNGEAGTTRLDVSASGAGNTIQLKFDPLAENVQRELQAAGLYKGDIDGVVGRHTRDAIVIYQKSNGLDVTGQPSQDLVEHIRYTRQIAEASLFTGSVEPAPDAEQRARVRRVQTALAELAYYQGEISGELARPTQIAIRQFEREHGLAETGAISDKLMTELAKISGQSQAQ